MEKKPFITLEQAKDIIKDVPTPFHIYDERGIRENARALNKAFSWNKGYKEFFAVKATPNPFLMQILKEEGCGFDCSSLTELTIPDGVTTIGSTAFRQCRGLEKVTIPDSVTSIGKMAFFDCTALHKVRIPSSTSDIGEMAFGYVLDNGAVPDPGFVMQGVDDSAAQQYAAANDIPFIPDGTMIRGDSDGDGRVTIIDATVIQRVLVGLPVASFNEICSDVDGNGLDITDATKIQRYLADIPDPYHIGEPIV